jgi:hypothetical protein
MVPCLGPGDAAGAPVVACLGGAGGRTCRATRCDDSGSSAWGWSPSSYDPSSGRNAAVCRQPARHGCSTHGDAPASDHRAAAGFASASRVSQATCCTGSSSATGRRSSASYRRSTNCRSSASCRRTSNWRAACADSPTHWRAPDYTFAAGCRSPGAGCGTAGPAPAPGSRGPAGSRSTGSSRCAAGSSIFVGAQIWGSAHKWKTDVRALVDHLAASSQFQEVNIGQAAVRLARSQRR